MQNNYDKDIIKLLEDEIKDSVEDDAQGKALIESLNKNDKLDSLLQELKTCELNNEFIDKLLNMLKSSNNENNITIDKLDEKSLIIDQNIIGNIKSKLMKIKKLSQKKRHDQKSQQNKPENNSFINFRNIIKKFVVYEIYKVLNPRRIAGETRLQNTINNMLVKSMKKGLAGKVIPIKNPTIAKNLNNRSTLSR